MSQLFDKSSAAKAPAADVEPQTKWGKILHFTPVIMTVVATVLAGMSSSEMTRAQYFRALASQNQSKVADQWAFFQAKRTRTLLLGQIGSLLDSLTTSDPVDAAELQSSADRLAGDFARAVQETEQVTRDIDQAEAAFKDKGRLKTAVEQFRKAAVNGAAEAEKLRQKTAGTLAHLAAQSQKDPRLAVFTYLNSDQMPAVEERRIEDPALTRARQAIQDRKPASELIPLLKEVNPKTLQEAIEAAEANAATFEVASKPIDTVFHTVDSLGEDQVRLARRLYRADQDLQRFLATIPEEEAKVPTDIRNGLDRIHRQAATVKTSADEVYTALKSAGDRLSAHRYERDARYNQEAAFLFEVQVHLNSLHSDRHLERSKNFFYGMLAAQLAVTTATLALAVQNKSLLWGLASMAGVGAVVYSVYVYLDLIP